jgi:hypothetical protein
MDSRYAQCKGVVPYEFVAHSYSSLTFSAYVSQSSFEIGSTANISASLLNMTQFSADEQRVGGN